MKSLTQRWMRKQLPTSDKATLSRELLVRDLGIATGLVALGAVVTLVIVGLTRPAPAERTKTPESVTQDGQAQTPQANMIYFRGVEPSRVARRAGVGVPQGTLVRVRLLNSLQTFETVPAFAQVIDYSLGTGLYGATLIGDANGDGSVERIKIRFNTLKGRGSSPSLQLDGQALSQDGTLGIRAEKLEGFMGRAMRSSAQSGAGGLTGLSGAKGDLNQFLLKALLSGLQSELSSDLSASFNRSVALTLEPGVEFLVQLTSDFTGSAK